jgi:hypothetical protein
MPRVTPKPPEGGFNTNPKVAVKAPFRGFGGKRIGQNIKFVVHPFLLEI